MLFEKWFRIAIAPLLVTIVGTGVFSRSVVAQQDESDVTLAEVRQVLRDLDADQLDQRDAAEKRLTEMGPAILQYLPSVTPRTSGEMKVRLQRIRQALQQNNVATHFEASKVNLSGKMTVGEALDEIAAQTGNAIELQDPDNTGGIELALDAEEAEFWDVLQQIMAAGKLRINAYGTTEDQLVLGPAGGNYDAIPHHATGPFFLNLLSVQATRPYQAGIDGQLDVSFLLTWEPRLKPVFMQVPMASVEAVTEGENTLSAVNAQAAPEVPLNLGGSSTQVDIQLQRPARSVEKLQNLRGELVIAVPNERHKYVFENFADGARQSEKFADVSVTLEGARRNGAVYEMRIFVEFGDSQGALDSFRGWILSNEAYLLDPRDRRQENVGLQTYAMTPNAVGIAYLFQINGDPNDYRLIYESPGVITRQTIRYELKDIELP